MRTWIALAVLISGGLAGAVWAGAGERLLGEWRAVVSDERPATPSDQLSPPESTRSERDPPRPATSGPRIIRALGKPLAHYDQEDRDRLDELIRVGLDRPRAHPPR